ncbi:MAG: dynamin family protein [Desulfobacteraceae bacterium]|nr:dynamin family protein [Desulfobacteraceae bacterium]
MDAFQKNREAILNVNQEFAALIQQAKAVFGGHDALFEQWQRSCESIADQLTAHIVQIAVVGAIKSGKSTLVNALLKNDYLKRGAGVVTSIVTRVRSGDQLRARLFFKSWDEINAEIQQALVLFPSNEWRSDTQSFDIRRSQDRGELKNAIESLDSELRVTQDSLNANGVLLSSYLKGFDQIHEYVASESTTREFDQNTFSDHRNFVGNDASAVYLKDIQLEVASDVLTRNIELADCQGSDSPNPLHLAMIQDYLLKAHLIIYVISSRTGIRQADIRFLSMIKRMGIAGSMLYVCNCDFNEHDTLEDLQALIQRIKEELALIVDDPKLFTLSALYNLFEETKPSEKDQERLNQWHKAETMVAFSNAETQRLLSVLDRKLTRERSALLLQNQMERIAVNAAGMRQWLRLNKDLIQRDTNEALKIIDRLDIHQSHMKQVQSMIQSTMEGAVRKVVEELKKEVDRFFDYHSGPILKQTIAFVRDHHIDLNRYKSQIGTSSFTHILYRVYQELKQAVDSYMAEKINPEIVAFINRQEVELQQYLCAAAEPYDAMVKEALNKHEDALAQFGLSGDRGQWSLRLDLDLSSIKQMAGLSLPAAATTLNYSSQIKTEAIIRLGYYNLVRALRKLFKKTVSDDKNEEIKALKDSIRKMKREFERSIQTHFKDYKENVKFQYIQRLGEAVGRRLFELLTSQFGAYIVDIKGFVSAIDDRRSDKKRLDSSLAACDQALEDLTARLESVRQEVRGLVEGGI